MGTITQIKIIKSLEDIALLMQGDIVEVEGRKYPIRIHSNEGKRLNVFGRGVGECIQWIEEVYSFMSTRDNKLIFLTNPTINTLWSNKWNDKLLYEYSRTKLEESGIWENA